MPKGTPKPRDPAAHLRSRGALRQRREMDRKKVIPRRQKHAHKEDT